MNQTIREQWSKMCNLDGMKHLKLIDISDLTDLKTHENSIVAVSDGWQSGKIATVLRGGSNAESVLNLMYTVGITEITIFHIEERIQHLEEVFLATVVEHANNLFDNVSIIWRRDSNIYHLLKDIQNDYEMVFLGAPLALSEIEGFYFKVKENFRGTVAIIRGLVESIDFDPSDQVYKWVYKRTYNAYDFSFASILKGLKEKSGKRVAVILPALNEARTVGKVIETALEVRQIGIIDEIILIDSDSSDNTIAIALEHEIPVFKHKDIHPDLGNYVGKGEAMFKSTFVTTADIIVWVDTDIESITPSFFYGLLGPMFTDPEVRFVKGFFERPVNILNTGVEVGGGRVTELMMRPWINVFMPELSGFIQPLSGTAAIYRDDLLKMRLPTNYGVEIAMLIQMVENSGIWSTCQVNLGTVVHKSKDIRGLSDMSFQIFQTIAELCGKDKNPGATIFRKVYAMENHFEIATKRYTIVWRDFIKQTP